MSESKSVTRGGPTVEELRRTLWWLMEKVDYERHACDPKTPLGEVLRPADLAAVRGFLERL